LRDPHEAIVGGRLIYRETSFDTGKNVIFNDIRLAAPEHGIYEGWNQSALLNRRVSCVDPRRRKTVVPTRP
jgi:hypothetical protein